MIEKALDHYRRYFIEKIQTHGPDPKGVDFNGSQAQESRFEQLAKVIEPDKPFTVIDYGCGYGALFDYLRGKNWEFTYFGLDTIEQMIAAGKQAHRDFAHAYFFQSENELAPADYLLAGSIFNNKFEAENEPWLQFILATLRRMNDLCVRGFSFNMLTRYSDEERMAQRPDLYFGDPLFFFDFCKRSFSRNVALLHDYGLYDFTILVRKRLP